jgi:hypothetical protein
MPAKEGPYPLPTLRARRVTGRKERVFSGQLLHFLPGGTVIFAELEIGKWRSETGARNPPLKDRNAKNRQSETGARLIASKRSTSCETTSSIGRAT